MERDLENMIMSEEQAHFFAVDIYNDVVKYFKELDDIVFNLLEELVAKAVFRLGGSIIIRDNVYQYNLCNYDRTA